MGDNGIIWLTEIFSKIVKDLHFVWFVTNERREGRSILKPSSTFYTSSLKFIIF